MRFERRSLLSFDWFWFLAVLALSGAGLLAIWSTTEGTSLNSYFGRQLIYLGLAMLAFLIVLYFDYHLYSDYVTLIYAAGIGVLILVLMVGHTIHNNKSWIKYGAFTFQPSELVKIFVIVALAKYYSESDRDHLDLTELILGGLIVFAPMCLVVLQGDLGTAVTFLPIYIALSFMGGIKRKHIVMLLLVVAAAIPVSWMMMHDYQKGRIETVLNPSHDPRRMGYQTIQSEIAIGSGRLTGKGFKQGSQGHLGFLPARHTDFVFAVLSEEKGFIGSITILALLLVICLRLLGAAREAKDKVGTLVIVGVLALFLFHIVINVGMVVGLLPIAGIPLPFVSAGGSSLISYFAAMSLCMNIKMRRYVN
ncbi:MAG TPA: rod shape-determining protein RodA [Acidobacteriota bacterium]|nr:rod shape-determining protein RodA [Acidobacteriota bacterium]